MPSRVATIVRIPVPIPFRPGSVNAYRVQLENGGWMLVDGGVDTPEAWAALDRGIRESGGWSDLRVNVATHMHIDHVGLARRVHLQAGCPLVLGELDAERMRSAAADPGDEASYRERLYREAGIPQDFWARAEAASSAGRDLAPFQPPAADIPIDRDDVPGAPEWRAIWTPGHTAGHIALFRPDDGALISGDAVLANISATIGVSRQRVDVVGDYLATLDRLASLPVRTIFPGHREPFDDVARIGELRGGLLREMENVRGLLDLEPRSAWEITQRRYHDRDLPLAALLLGVRETYAHLIHLERAGGTDSTTDAGGTRRFSRRRTEDAPVPRTDGRADVFQVALTGNIAAGKSAVANVWKREGVPVVEADALAREAVAPGSEGLQRIVQRWGEEVLDAEGALDRAAMRTRVFNDDAERTALEAIVHPEVERLRRQAIHTAASAGETMIVADIPLLFEVEMEDQFDAVVLVDAPADIRLDRIVRNRGLDAASAQAMIDAQMPADAKRAAADYVIDNAGTLEDLEERALSVLAELRTRAQGARH